MNSSKTTQLYPYHHSSTPQTTGMTKYATLSPYLAQIQVKKQQFKKRKKNRELLRENRAKSKNESSSKSFRIKQRSTSSLQSQGKKELNSKTIISIISKINSKKKQQNNNRTRAISMNRQKVQNPSSSFTVKADPNRAFSRNDAIDIREKKHKKQLSFRKNKYESRSRNQNVNEKDLNKQTIQVTKHGNINFYKGYTDTNRTRKDDEIVAQENTITQNMYGIGKKKFRRGKYEALYSSVNSSDVNQQKDNPTKSQSHIQITKKQSNLSINRQVDLLAQKQMQRFYCQMRSKQIRKSLQKSTENYFKQDSFYRMPKTNNDIQIYVSTVKNPISRKSNTSTNNTEQRGSIYVSSIQKSKQNNFLNYDFEFKQSQTPNLQIIQTQNPSEQESLNIQQETSFQKQRKQVQKQYFHKKSPQIDWSEQDCQIDEL